MTHNRQTKQQVRSLMKRTGLPYREASQQLQRQQTEAAETVQITLIPGGAASGKTARIQAEALKHLDQQGTQTYFYQNDFFHEVPQELHLHARPFYGYFDATQYVFNVDTVFVDELRAATDFPPGVDYVCTIQVPVGVDTEARTIERFKSLYGGSVPSSWVLKVLVPEMFCTFCGEASDDPVRSDDKVTVACEGCYAEGLSQYQP